MSGITCSLRVDSYRSHVVGRLKGIFWDEGDLTATDNLCECHPLDIQVITGGQLHGCDYSHCKSLREISCGTRGLVGLRERNTFGWSDSSSFQNFCAGVAENHNRKTGTEGALTATREAPESKKDLEN